MNKITPILIASLFSVSVLAQTSSFSIDFNSSSTGLPLQVSLTVPVPEQGFNAWVQERFFESGELSLTRLRSERDGLGWTHTRLQQYYKGYPIEGSTLITHSMEGMVQRFNGDWFKAVQPQNAIVLSEQQALAAALKKVNAKSYKWENAAEQEHMREALNQPGFTYAPKGQLVLLPDVNAQTVSYRFAWKFNIYAQEPLYRAYVFIDAGNGTVLREQNLLCTVDAVGTAVTKYSGTKPITTDSYAGGYRLRETGRGNGVETYNLNNSGTYSNTDFTNATNTWTSTGTNQTATDAHFGAEKTYDFYYTTFNRNSIDNNGFKLLSYVHANLVAMGFPNNVNAFWDGQRMTYGDGNTSQGFTIMTALDVCGHEITHGVVENTANLGNGEAAALNEAFADIFGTSVEWYARPTQHDWIIGADITTSGNGIRNMSNPNSHQQPDTYQGTYWDAGGEEHTNNGPCIYWFYLLSVGGSGTNDNSNAYSVSSITMAKAEAIAYRAMTVYMTPGTTYANVRNYTIQAARDLYGACSNEVIQTTNAWYAVGVGGQYVSGTIGPNFTADNLTACTLPLTVNFNNTTANGQTYTWRFGDGTTSTATNPAHTYTANGTYSVKLVATGCATGSKDSTLKTGYITVNAPAMPLGTGASICNGMSAQLSASGGTIKWYDVPGGTVLGSGNTFSTPALNTTTTYYAVTTVSSSPVFGGPATNTAFGSGSNFNGSTTRYLIFDVLQPCTLKSVRVYANSAGNRVIELRDANGAVLQSATVNIAAGTQTVVLNFALTPGSNYQLGTGGTLVDLYRNNTGSGYPYNINSLVSITAADAGASYYYYYYNWEVQKADCQSPAAAVTATVSICMDVAELAGDALIQLYPNPASGQLTISSTNNEAGSLVIYDALGKQLRTLTMASGSLQFDVSELAPGMYTCRFTTTGHKTGSLRFIKE